MTRMKNRAVSLLLVLLLAVSAAGICGFSAMAASTDSAAASAGGNLVYFKNTSNWAEVYIHYWKTSNTSDTTSWPGKAMTKVSGTTDVYSYEVPAGYDGVVFNNKGNGQQTGDQTIPGGNQIFDPKTNGWSEYTGPAATTSPTTATTATTATQSATSSGDRVVYCQNDKGWPSVSIYMWNDENDTNGGWPGVAMTDIGDGIWCYEMPKDYANVIFSNNGADKTGDLTLPGNGKIYNNATGAWDVYDASPLRVTSFTTDNTSPQYTGVDITVSANAKSSEGTVSYKFSVTNSSGNTTVLSNFSAANSVVWTPTAVGSYVITLDVKDTAGNTNRRTLDYVIEDASLLIKPVIKGVNPRNNGEIQVNTTANINVSAGGGNTGTKLLFYKYVVTDPDGVKNTPYYSLSRSYQITPDKLGEYKVQVYVQGSDNQTVNKTYKYQSVSTVAPTTQAPSKPVEPTQATDPTQATNPTITSYPDGDVTLSGKLDIRDASLIQAYIAKVTVFNDLQKSLADYDKSGKIDIRDSSAIQKTLAKIP